MLKFGKDGDNSAPESKRLYVGGHTYDVLHRLQNTPSAATYLVFDSSQSRVPRVLKYYKNPNFAARSNASHRLIQKFRRYLCGIMPDIVEQGQSHQVTQFFSGPDLEVYFRQPKKASEIHSIAFDLARKIGVLLRLGLVHGDIKPSNVLLPFPWRGDHPATAIIDFDFLAHPGLRALREGRDILGTPFFCAPEQCRGDTTASTDVYSFGIVLYALLSECYELPPIFGDYSMSGRDIVALRARPYYSPPEEFVSRIMNHIQLRQSPSPDEMRSIRTILECIAYCTRYYSDLRPQTGEDMQKILLRGLRVS